MQRCGLIHNNNCFPTPAPPNSPTFPPFEYGANKSTTLIPVSETFQFFC